MSDIVERLNKAASVEDAGPGCCRIMTAEAIEAAAELTRLRSQLARAVEILKRTASTTPCFIVNGYCVAHTSNLPCFDGEASAFLKELKAAPDSTAP